MKCAKCSLFNLFFVLFSALQVVKAKGISAIVINEKTLMANSSVLDYSARKTFFCFFKVKAYNK